MHPFYLNTFKSLLLKTTYGQVWLKLFQCFEEVNLEKFMTMITTDNEHILIEKLTLAFGSGELKMLTFKTKWTICSFSWPQSSIKVTTCQNLLKMKIDVFIVKFNCQSFNCNAAISLERSTCIKDKISETTIGNTRPVCKMFVPNSITLVIIETVN